MKAWLAGLLMATTFALPLAAQQPSPNDSTIAPSATTSYAGPAVVIGEPQLARNDVVATKKFKVTGLLVRPFKAIRLHKAGGALASLFQAINPFSREGESREDPRFVGELNTRAWSSSVGWRSGSSGIPNPVTHEVGLTVLSVSR